MKRCVVLLSAFLCISCQQKNENVVAVVNGQKIFAEPFAERYMKFLSAGGHRDNILLRQNVLNNMINERLIFADCASQGFDSDEQYRRRMDEIESQAYVDEYTKRITVDTIKTYEAELQQEFRNYNTKVRARYLYAETEDAAHKLKESLDQGTTFEERAQEIFEDPGLANNGGDLGYFGWGEMEPAFEDVAYSLPVGATSEPVRLNIGFGIIQVLDRKNVNLLASALDYARVKVKLERAIINRKAIRLAREAAFGIVEDLEPKFDEGSVQAVLKNWQFVAGEMLQTEQHSTFENKLKDRPLVHFKHATWKIGDVIEKAVKTSERQRKRVKTENDVKEFVKGLALREELLTRARKAGMNSDPEIRKEIEARRDHFLLKRWMLSVRDTVGQSGWPDSAMRMQYEKFRKEYAFPPEVNVAEILVRTSAEATKILSQLRSGADFGSLAKKHSLRRTTAKRNGEIGWGTRGTFGNMAEKFFAANVGQILGPEFVDPYYGVFTILGKNDGRPKTFDEAKGLIASQLASARKLEVVEQVLSGMRSKTQIEINNEVLANIVIHLN